MKNIRILDYLKRYSKNTLLFLIVASGIFAAVVSNSSLQLSRFNTSDQVTAQNAANLWVGSSENTFRKNISSSYIAKLDLLVVAILRKGANMSNDQFETYLKNLSQGINNLGSKPVYVNDVEIQNILGFLVYEINSTITQLHQPVASTSAISEIAQLISTAPTDITGDVKDIENEALNVTSTTTTAPVTPPIQQNQILYDVPVKYTTAVGGSIQADCWSLPKLQLNSQTNANIIGLIQSANSYGNLDFMYCTVHGGQPHFYTLREDRTCLPSGDISCYKSNSSVPVCESGKEVEYYFYHNPGLKDALNGNSPIDHWNNYGLNEGRKSCWTTKIGANGEPIIASQPTEVPQIVNTNTRNKTTFGIFYSAWHCPVVKHPALPILYTSDLTTQFQNQFHFWGKPKLGHYCLTDREDVLRQHAIWLKDAGIEYIVFDSTNHAYLDSRSDRTREMVIDPFAKLLEVWSTIPGAPKVVPWVPVVQGGDVYGEMKNILDRYPAMKFQFKGKPLFIVTGDVDRFVSDAAAIASLEQTYTVRTMWGLQNGGNLHKWSFLEQNGLNGVRNGEQITVSAAYQQTHITESTGVGKNNGETFKTQFSTVFANPGVDTVLISSWNEWMGQKFIIDGKITYTDSFDEDKNRDIEPQEGGKGSFYYNLMSKCIASYKSGGNSCE